MILSNILLSNYILFQYSLFKINQSYIAKYECIQKEDLDNICMGSCYLEKEINHDDKQSSPIFNINEIKVESGVLLNYILHLAQSIQEIKFFNFIQIFYSFKFSNSLFHPPISLF